MSANTATAAPATDGPATAENPWPVGVLADKVRGYIDRLGQVWVEGEITQWGRSGGNVYGKLKDLQVDATISFSIWSSIAARVPDDLKQGDRVAALVKPNYWVKGGTLTMQVFAMRHVGLGDLLEKLERLRRQLAAEGLFGADRKRPLPFLPKTIGLITGKDSDAEKDVLRNAQLRWPQVAFRIEYAAVQGDRTVPEVLAALARLDADPAVDVIIVARGGGDFQNLLGFSDERLVRAVAAATTPVVSAIGHEADRPLLDDVADLRASTPTDAAKRVVPDVAEELNNVTQSRARIRNRITQLITVEVDRLRRCGRGRCSRHRRRCWRSARRRSPGTWLVRTSSCPAGSTSRSARSPRSRGHLRALSPERTLERGYAIVLAGGAALTTTAGAPAGTPLTVRVADGAVGATSTGPVGKGS